MGIGFVVAALMPTYLLFGIALLALGFCQQTFMATASSTVQLWTEPAMRGWEMAIYMAILNGSALFGSPFVDWWQISMGRGGR